jgi:hypothetical protein
MTRGILMGVRAFSGIRRFSLVLVGVMEAIWFEYDGWCGGCLLGGVRRG